MGREFHYSFNALSIEESALLNQGLSLEEVHAARVRLLERAVKDITADERANWVLVDQYGLWGGSLHEVYISFKITWLLTPKGRRRRINRVLRMIGVPFIKFNGVEVVNIVALKET